MASCQQPSGQGRGVGRPQWAQRVGQTCTGRGEGIQGNLGNNRDGRRQETEGIGVSFQQEKEGRREWLEAEEARREGKCW